MLPFKLKPVFKDYLWGGTRLKTAYGKQTDLPIVAESWELSTHPDGSSVVGSGPHKGETLAALLRAHPEACGSGCKNGEFPILIKLIDAAKSLSIQVHPDDAYARRVEGEQGKNEMWIILDCEPGAFLYFGFDHAITREEMERRIAGGTLTEVLHKAPVKPGDVFYIQAGTIHAIGAGILLAEVQQNSNSTYRVYDFGRLGADDKPRELHVQKALDVTTLGPATATPPGAGEPRPMGESTLRTVADSGYFKVERLELKGRLELPAVGDSFLSLLCTAGTATLACGGETLALAKGETAFLPAGSPAYTLEGEGDILLAGA